MPANQSQLHVLRVFCGADGAGGNALGVYLNGSEIPDADERQAIAAELGFAETVFVDDRGRGKLRIFTPAIELPLAGHPLVGTAWLLAHEGNPVDVLRPPAGEVGVTYDGEATWIAGRAEWAPPFQFVELGSPGEVDALESAPDGMDWVGLWAWVDEEAGVVRERVFAGGGVGEDEATGSAAMRLVVLIDRPIEIRQGKGSVLNARPLGDGRAEVGGRVVLDEVRGGL